MASPTAWPSWSPELCPSRTRIPSRFFQVPSDQQKLLNRDDAWFTRGVPNVPPKVLEDARAHHAKAAGEGRPPSAQSASSGRPTRESLSPQSESPASAAGKAHTLDPPPASPTQHTSVQDDDAEEEPSGTPISWPPSPSAHFRAPDQHQQDELATTGLTTTSTNPSRHRPDQQGRPVASKAVPPARFLNEPPPSSSATSEMELEYEAPKAVTDTVKPVNRQAIPLLEPTPPSAQIIPCTLVEPTSPPAQPPAAKRVRRMRPPSAAFSGLSQGGQKAATNSTPGVEPAVLSGLSSPVPSSSAVHDGRLTHPGLEASSVMVPVEEGGHPKVASRQVANNDEWSSNPVPAGGMPPNGPASQVPFTAFRVAYPDYSGTLGDFVRGVICILQLQRERRLPEFLYDDFIRVFSADYLDYIGALESNQPALPAIEWYNENVTRPLYLKRILDKDNVKGVPTKYPDKLRSIQQQLDESDTHAHRRTPRPLPDVAKRAREVAQKKHTSGTTARPHDETPRATSSTHAAVTAAIKDTALPSSTPYRPAESHQAVPDSTRVVPEPMNTPSTPVPPPNPQPSVGTTAARPSSAAARISSPPPRRAPLELKSKPSIATPLPIPHPNVGATATGPSSVAVRMSPPPPPPRRAPPESRSKPSTSLAPPNHQPSVETAAAIPSSMAARISPPPTRRAPPPHLSEPIDSSLPDLETHIPDTTAAATIQALPLPQRANIGRRIASTLPTGAGAGANNTNTTTGAPLLSQVSNADSIPESAAVGSSSLSKKRRRGGVLGTSSSAAGPPPSTVAGGGLGLPGGENAFKRPRGENKKERSAEEFDQVLARWKRFLVKRGTQGSTPGGTAGP